MANTKTKKTKLGNYQTNVYDVRNMLGYIQGLEEKNKKRSQGKGVIKARPWLKDFASLNNFGFSGTAVHIYNVLHNKAVMYLKNYNSYENGKNNKDGKKNFKSHISQLVIQDFDVSEVERYYGSMNRSVFYRGVNELCDAGVIKKYIDEKDDKKKYKYQILIDFELPTYEEIEAVIEFIKEYMSEEILGDGRIEGFDVGIEELEKYKDAFKKNGYVKEVVKESKDKDKDKEDKKDKDKREESIKKFEDLKKKQKKIKEKEKSESGESKVEETKVEKDELEELMEDDLNW